MKIGAIEIEAGAGAEVEAEVGRPRGIATLTAERKTDVTLPVHLHISTVVAGEVIAEVGGDIFANLLFFIIPVHILYMHL
jgi:hypothetical protein